MLALIWTFLLCQKLRCCTAGPGPGTNSPSTSPTISFSTLNPGKYSIFPTNPDPAASASGTAGVSPVELGVQFYADYDGYISGIRFYKGVANTGVHNCTLWSINGTALAKSTFLSETSYGWQQVLFSKAVAIVANDFYVASYYSSGSYNYATGYFNTQLDNPPLHAPATQVGTSKANGRYAFSSVSIFPSNTFNGLNYFVDVIYGFSPTSNPTTKPTITPSKSPSYLPTTYPSLISPSSIPTVLPSIGPSQNPSNNPSKIPSGTPTVSPTTKPTYAPSYFPSLTPSFDTSVSPSFIPTQKPLLPPTNIPSNPPTYQPTIIPTPNPSNLPTNIPLTIIPSFLPSVNPISSPSSLPTVTPSSVPQFRVVPDFSSTAGLMAGVSDCISEPTVRGTGGRALAGRRFANA